MTTHDRNNSEYAKTDEVVAGDILRCDGGFPCLAEWTDHRVHNDEDGLYINCKDGPHYLDSQYNEEETHYIGLYKHCG